MHFIVFHIISLYIFSETCILLSQRQQSCKDVNKKRKINKAVSENPPTFSMLLSWLLDKMYQSKAFRNLFQKILCLLFRQKAWFFPACLRDIYLLASSVLLLFWGSLNKLTARKDCFLTKHMRVKDGTAPGIDPLLRDEDLPRTCRALADDLPRTCRGLADDLPRTCWWPAEAFRQ